MEKIKQHKKIIIISAISLAVIGFCLIWFFSAKNEKNIPYNFVSATKGDFVREVNLTGTIKPAEDIKLSFENQGKVSLIKVKAGDVVKAGQVLVELDKKTLMANYSQAQANLEIQQAKKQDLLAGAKNEDVAVSEASVQTAKNNLADAESKAQTDLTNVYSQINNAFNDAYAKSYNAVYVQTNGMFDDNISDNPKLSFETPLDSNAKNEVEAKKVLANQAMTDIKIQLTSIAPDFSNYEEVLAQIEKDVALVQDFSNSLNYALQDTVGSVSFPDSLITGYKSSTNNAISSLNGVATSLNSLKQTIVLQKKNSANAIDAAQNALDLANSQLTLKKSGATSAQINMQDAQTAVAYASLQIAAAQLDKMSLKAPVDGIITNVDLDLGEIVSPNVPIVTMESNGKFQVETYLPEIYIGEIKAGSLAVVTFDAYGSDKKFDAKVISVDPATTIVDGSPSYRALLEFVNEDEAIKAGLTANLKILADKQTDVIMIPESAIIRQGEKSFVILESGERQEIVVGKTGDDNKTLVVSGLVEGEKVADFGATNN